MTFIKNNLALIALIIAIIALFYPQAPSNLGAIVDTSYFDYFDASTGYKVNGTTMITSSGVVGPVAATTGTFSSTLGVTGTTTLSNGLNMNKVNGACISFYATSTATRVKFQFEATAATSTFPGAMLASYGACPN